MQTYLISLDSAVERRNFQRNQLERLGLNFQIHPACTPRQLDLYSNIDWHAWERPLMPTEQACFVSHYQIWQQVSKQSQPSLVLEDDVLLSIRTPDFLRNCTTLKGVDHLTLETRLRKKFLGQSLEHGGFSISRLYQDRTGAAAYVLWPQGAMKMLQRVDREGAALADAFISHSYEMSSYQAEPALAIQSDITSYYRLTNPLDTHSYIQEDAQTFKRQLENLAHLQPFVFKWRRIKSQLKMGVRNLFLLLRAQRRHVPPDPQGFDKSEN